MQHELKIWPPYFEEVATGARTFEVRFNDRRYSVGDVLLLREYLPTDSERKLGRSFKDSGGKYSERSIKRRIVYMLDPVPGRDPDVGLVAGYVVLGLAPVPEAEMKRRQSEPAEAHA